MQYFDTEICIEGVMQIRIKNRAIYTQRNGNVIVTFINVTSTIVQLLK